jgi:hypothetical protein
VIPLSVTTNLDLNPWTDLRGNVDFLMDPEGKNATVERIGVLPNGTHQGRACVELLIKLPDGRLVIAETTLRLFRMAAAAVLATPTAQMEDL